MRRILSSPPDLTWEVSRLLPASGYLHFPDRGGGPGFYLTRTGFHHFDPEGFSLRYERTAEGFTMIEVRKRSGTTTLAECPVYFPLQNCVERHHLMLATILTCEASCRYRFVVFDSHSPYPVLLEEPAVGGFMKRLADPWLAPPDLEVRFEESGTVFDTDSHWVRYLGERFAYISRRIEAAEKPPGFRLARPPEW